MQITSVDVSREVIEITSRAGEPDPAWRYQDVLGQVHRWHGRDLPTLERRVSETYVDEEGELHESWDWHVPATGERVEPEMHRHGERRFMPGLTTVSGKFISDDQPNHERHYRLEDCGSGLIGSIIVTRWSRCYPSGEYEGDWVASGPVEVVNA